MKNHKTYFIGLCHPWGMVIAVQLGDPEYHGSYKLIDDEYGWDNRSKFEESKQLEEIGLDKLPSEIRNNFDFKRKYVDAEQVEFVWVYKDEL